MFPDVHGHLKVILNFHTLTTILNNISILSPVDVVSVLFITRKSQVGRKFPSMGDSSTKIQVFVPVPRKAKPFHQIL